MSPAFFTDRDLGKRFPEILEAAGLSVERHCDLFPPDGSDEQWLEYVGRRGLVAITHDGRIRYKPNELAAVRRHGVALLVVIGKAPIPVLAQSFVATMPRIEAFLARHTSPFIAKVYRASVGPGSVSLWYPQ